MNISQIKLLGCLAVVSSSTGLWATERFVSPVGGHVSPFISWANAATNIQSAIDAATAGDVIRVTNGIYSVGGKVMAGDLTNRVALNKSLTVQSVNGPLVTTIQGRQDATSTNGPGAVRCAWLTNNAVLSGFTLSGGATRAIGDFTTLCNGGGAWCASTNTIITNCFLFSNTASFSGGGSYLGTLVQCVLSSNTATGGDGGGAAGAALVNCYLVDNKAYHAGGGTFGGTARGSAYVDNYAGEGGGAYGGTLLNCTLVGNSVPVQRVGGGVDSASLSNCLVYFNAPTNYLSSSFRYSCSLPLPSGTGNISADPQLVDEVHIGITSPCRGMGSSLAASGTDIDGEAWANPPAMGCDEVLEAALTGLLLVAIEAPQTESLVNRALFVIGRIAGRATRLEWSFDDGPSVTNVGYTTSHVWTNAGDYMVTFTAFNTDNPGGVFTNLLVHVLPLNQPLLQSSRVASNDFRFEFSGQAGTNYFIEMATNLTSPITWQTIKTAASTGSVVQVIDSVSTNATQFYRVRAQ